MDASQAIEKSKRVNARCLHWTFRQSLLVYCCFCLIVGGGTRNQGESSWVLSNSGESLSGLTGHPVIRYLINIFYK